VAVADSHSKSRPSGLTGDALCLISGVFYACYTVAIKKMLGRDEDTNMVLFFGYVGLINLVSLAPLLLLLGLVSAVDFTKLTLHMFGLVVAKGTV
jgi:drug/metabolite transporter (DMT)-like permease